MKISIGFLIAIFIFNGAAHSQSIRFLGSEINYAGFNKLYPAFSGDGKSLTYMYDYSDDGGFVTLYSYKDGIDWVKPIEVTIMKPEKVNLEGGHCMNYSGDVIYFTSRRSNSVGGYDIWYVSRGEKGWSSPRNLGIPINSKGHDAFPSLSTDGNTLYFSRCSEMSDDGWSGCKIMMAKKKKGQRGGWEEPTELPPPINMGNDAAPKILSDGVSLVFASDRPGGKGDIDLYFSKLENDTWSNPKNMTFVNTDGYDISYSMYYRADQAITAAKDRRNKMSLGYVRVPEEFQPKDVLSLTGSINFQDPDANGNLIVRNFDSGEIISRVSLRNQSNNYEITLPSEGIFEFYAETLNPKLTFYSQIYDTEDLSSSSRKVMNIDLELIEDGTVIPLNALYFNEENFEVDQRSKNEIKRIERIIKNNPNWTFEFLVWQDTVLTDSIQRPDIMIAQLDTIQDWIIKDTVINTAELESDQLDSMLMVWNDSLSNTYYDSLITDQLLTKLIVSDSVLSEKVVTTYTNDRTPKLAESIIELLTSSGISAEQVSAEGLGNISKPDGSWNSFQLEKGFVVVVVEEEY